MNTQVTGPKRNRWAGIFVMMLSVIVVFSSFAIAAYADRAEDLKYTEATGTPSFGTEDWTGPEEQAQVVTVQPPSFGTEDWTGPTEQGPIVAVKSPSLGTEAWTGSMESSQAMGAGAIAAPACEDVSPDDYSPEC